eukprot:359060-Chlamydomonas_euryale.AAC.2
MEQPVPKGLAHWSRAALRSPSLALHGRRVVGGACDASSSAVLPAVWGKGVWCGAHEVPHAQLARKCGALRLPRFVATAIFSFLSAARPSEARDGQPKPGTVSSGQGRKAGAWVLPKYYAEFC